MDNIARWLLVFALTVATPLAAAGVAVIVHPTAPVDRLTVDQIAQVFLQIRALPGGALMTPLDLPEGEPVRVQFVERVLGKNEQQLRSYWSRIIFTGKGQPPRSVNSAAEVVKMVASTPGFIGYVDAKEVVAGKVKVLYQIQ